MTQHGQDQPRILTEIAQNLIPEEPSTQLRKPVYDNGTGEFDVATVGVYHEGSVDQDAVSDLDDSGVAVDKVIKGVATLRVLERASDQVAVAVQPTTDGEGLVALVPEPARERRAVDTDLMTGALQHALGKAGIETAWLVNTDALPEDLPERAGFQQDEAGDFYIQAAAA